MVRLDYDGGLEPTHGIYITVEVKNAMQHTIKRAELTASLRHHRSMCGVLPQRTWTTRASVVVFGRVR